MTQDRRHRIDLPSTPGHKRGLARLRSDFRLTIISLFGLCSALGILPLAVYRYAVGDWQTGTGDLALVGLIAVIVAYAWKSGRTRLAARLAALIVTFGYLALVTFGSISVMWAFPILGAGFLLADRVFASLSALGILVLTGLFSGRFDNDVDLWSFVITGLMVSIFGLIFATRTEMQRRQLAEIASHDPLTQAGNRRALRIGLDEAARAYAQREEPASVLLIDLDHFKAVNDAYGHDAGDRVLVDTVDLLNASLREGDGVYRLGGEEFVVVLPDTDIEGAEQVAGKLKNAFHAQLEGPGGPVTASIGVAQFGTNESLSHWLTRADEALYKAKKQGRDRIVVAEEYVNG